MWSGSVFVVEWGVVDPAGAPVADAEVTATVSRPGGATAAMVIDHEPGSSTWRASYAAPAAGTYGFKLVATVEGQPAGSTAGEFVVDRDRTGAAPITLDEAQPVGMMRLLTTDVDEAFPILTDAQYTALLTLEGGNVKRGAAAALETIATSETLRTKKITTQDLSVDGPAVAEDLRKRAALLRGQADKADQDAAAAVDDADGFGFDYVGFNPHAGLRGYPHGWS